MLPLMCANLIHRYRKSLQSSVLQALSLCPYFFVDAGVVVDVRAAVEAEAALAAAKGCNCCSVVSGRTTCVAAATAVVVAVAAAGRG